MPDSNLNEATVFALKLLGQRSHSRNELERKLKKKGYEVNCIEEVMEKLTRQGLLDDRVFGGEFIRSRSRQKPAGKLKIRSELRKRGVSDIIISSLVNELDTRELCRQAAEKKSRSLQRVSETDRKKKLEQFLHNRGFEWQDIQPVVKLLVKAGPDNDESYQHESP
ncbi:MAG: recombination regulator RecX [Chlorobiaceae bacterium]|nr:recombination regulator RecX [Chlorobiaceae bacterium]